MKNFSPLPPGGHGHPPDPGSSLMGLVCCKESSGDLAGLWPGHPTWVLPPGCRVLEGSSCLQIQGQRGGRSLSLSQSLLFVFLSGLQSISQKNKRESAARWLAGFGCWLSTGWEFLLKSQLLMWPQDPGSELFKAAHGRGGKVQASLVEEPVAVGVPFGPEVSTLS